MNGLTVLISCNLFNILGRQFHTQKIYLTLHISQTEFKDHCSQINLLLNLRKP